MTISKAFTMIDHERRRSRNWRALKQLAEGKQMTRAERIERGLTASAIAKRFGLTRERLYQFAREMDARINGSAA